jgi:hypothetical protein
MAGVFTTKGTKGKPYNSPLMKYTKEGRVLMYDGLIHQTAFVIL